MPGSRNACRYSRAVFPAPRSWKMRASCTPRRLDVCWKRSAHPAKQGSVCKRYCDAWTTVTTDSRRCWLSSCHAETNGCTTWLRAATPKCAAGSSARCEIWPKNSSAGSQPFCPRLPGRNSLHCFATPPKEATNPAFSAWRKLDCLPQTSADRLDAWQALAELLLTRNGSWRKQPRADIGFGADHAVEKQRLLDLIATLKGERGLRDSLAAIRSVPAPHYDEAQWQILAALRLVLRDLTAELRVVFTERNCVDFVELALAAQSALGEADAPSELLLALDHRIQHILVDEFQDTSHTQLRLLELLTAGWQPADGRTLFLVGDPMQSIYRFRNADMSLFLKTQARGIGDVPCRSLTLTRNFRSAPAIIDWVNTTFPDIFPEHDEVGAGAARFHSCEPVREPSADANVEFHALRGTDSQSEVDRVIEILLDERDRYPEASVAILVQSRSHLEGLHEQLRARQLDVHAVELEPPKNRQVVQDLLGLTRALTHLADRVAWLSVLRAPWCGMTWSDMHTLVGNDRRSTALGAHERPTARRVTHRKRPPAPGPLP